MRPCSAIDQCVTRTYSKLFKAKGRVKFGKAEELLHTLPKLDEETSDVLNGRLQLSEVRRAIKSLKLGKSPRTDGIGSTF